MVKLKANRERMTTNMSSPLKETKASIENETTDLVENPVE
jgi:hypothetical protein